MALIDLSAPDPNRNRRNGLIMALVIVLYLALVVKCAGQCAIRVKPDRAHPTVTRILACDGFQSEPINDKSIFVGIYVDSIDVNVSIPVVYVMFSKGVKLKNSDILITFENEDIPEMVIRFNDTINNYIEFTSKDPYFYSVRNFKINFIHVINDEVGYYVYGEKMDLFYEFFRNL